MISIRRPIFPKIRLLGLYLALLLGVSGLGLAQLGMASIFTVGPGPVTIQLPEGADLVVYGPGEFARIGHASVTGDFNDDGRPDLVIGSVGCGPGAYILWGRERFPREIDLASSRRA